MWYPSRLLPQNSLSGLRLWVILILHLYCYLFWWGSCLERPCSQSLSLPLLLCLHIQFPEDMCTNSGFFLFWLAWDLCLHIQFLKDMCTNSWNFLLTRKFLVCILLGKITLLMNVLVPTREPSCTRIIHKNP